MQANFLLNRANGTGLVAQYRRLIFFSDTLSVLFVKVPSIGITSGTVCKQGICTLSCRIIPRDTKLPNALFCKSSMTTGMDLANFANIQLLTQLSALSAPGVLHEAFFICH